jgi:uncharacterized protein YeaO (DUF488 family)
LLWSFLNNPKGKNNDNNDFRILVDRLWPRGLSKDKVKVDLWEKEIAPSNTLRKWFSHDENKWNEKSELVNMVISKVKESSSTIITLLYSTKEDRFNNAVALKEYLEEKIKEYRD